jgi:hypothetical protein
VCWSEYHVRCTVEPGLELVKEVMDYGYSSTPVGYFHAVD